MIYVLILLMEKKLINLKISKCFIGSQKVEDGFYLIMYDVLSLNQILISITSAPI